MPEYIIEQYEYHSSRYRVIADSVADAIDKLYQSSADAQPIDDSLTYIGIADDMSGLDSEDYPNVCKELRRRGHIDVDDWVPSIRDVWQVEPDGTHIHAVDDKENDISH